MKSRAMIRKSATWPLAVCYQPPAAAYTTYPNDSIVDGPFEPGPNYLVTLGTSWIQGKVRKLTQYSRPGLSNSNNRISSPTPPHNINNIKHTSYIPTTLSALGPIETVSAGVGNVIAPGQNRFRNISYSPTRTYYRLAPYQSCADPHPRH